MLDPQTIQSIILVAALVFFLSLILGMIFALVLLAKIRSQAVRINKRLEELLARPVAGSASVDERKISL